MKITITQCENGNYQMVEQRRDYRVLTNYIDRASLVRGLLEATEDRDKEDE